MHIFPGRFLRLYLSFLDIEHIQKLHPGGLDVTHKNRVRLELLLTPLHTIIVCPECTECLSAACYCANSAWRRFQIPARVVIGEISILEMTARSPGPTPRWLVSHALMHVLERTPGRKHAPDAHAHFPSTDVGTLCADLLMQRVLRCRAAASFGSLTWNRGHVFQLKNSNWNI